MIFGIEVNVARQNTVPIWRALIDETGKPCRWEHKADAIAALAEENRSDNARLVCNDD